MRRKFPLKVYDVDEIEEDVRRVCSGGSSHDGKYSRWDASQRGKPAQLQR